MVMYNKGYHHSSEEAFYRMRMKLSAVHMTEVLLLEYTMNSKL